MSVRKQKRAGKDGKSRIFWIVDIVHRHPDGTEQRVRRVPRDNTKVGAERVEREIIRELEAGTFGKKKISNPTFASFAKDYEKECITAASAKPSTALQKKMIIREHLVPYFGRMRMNALDARAVEAYKNSKIEETSRRGTKFSRRTLNNHLTTLRTLLRAAVKWKCIAEVPDFKVFKLLSQPFNFLDFDEADRLKAVMRSEPLWEAVFSTALNTGMRVGEILALRWDNVDLKRRKLYVRENDWHGIIGTPKSGKERQIALNDEALDVLTRHKHVLGPLVFCKENGKRLDAAMCSYALRRMCRLAKVKLVRFHDLRHTFASHLVMLGAPLKAVQELLGHATIEMTMRYSHLTPDFRKEAVMRLGSQRPPDGHKTEVR